MVGVNKKFFHHVGGKSIYWAQDCKCFYCGREISGKLVTRDHLYPKSEGNTLVLNCVICCQRCNVTKGNRQPTQVELIRARKIYQSLGCPIFAI